jgi:hypothetical protein
MPLNDLLIPAREWRPSQAAIPRSILKSIASTVRAGLGGDVVPIETLIAGHDTDALDVIARAGASLWGRAGDILAPAPSPIGWEDTGLPDSAYAPLVRAIATVLQRAEPLRFLQREAELGMLEPNKEMIAAVVANIAREPSEGRALILKLVLTQFPHAAVLLRQLISASDTPAERASLQAAIDAGVENVLHEMEQTPALAGTLVEIGAQVGRITEFLRDLNDDTKSPRVRARLQAIRNKMDALCLDRFVEGLKEGLVGPLDARQAPIHADDQRELEACARDLRMVETAGRKLGSPTTYDALLSKAGSAVEGAMEAGTLSHIGAVRLVEILVGADEAAKLYRRKPRAG